MPIDTSLVSDAVLTRLREAWPRVGDGRAVDGVGAYGVLDLIAGGGSDGDMDLPERDSVLHFRVTAVSRDPDGAASADGARVQAQHIAWRLHTAMLDRSNPISGSNPVSGDEWMVTGREHIASGGALREGTVVNVVNDYEMWAVEVPIVVP